MTADTGIGEVLFQGADEDTHGVLLLPGTGVRRPPLRVETTLIGYPDALLVETAGMGTYHVHGPGGPDEAVLADVEVITHHLHAPRPMAAEQVFLGEVHVLAGGGAVNHNQGDGAGYPTHAVTPRAPAIPDATAMMIFRMSFHTFSLFSSFMTVVV